MKWGKIAATIALLGGGIWLIKYLTQPVPGQRLPDMGRDHVSAVQVAQTQYNSNPPTTGPHLKTWVKPGIYDRPLSEGELIHSLEHGYVIISYNCNVHLRGNLKSQISITKQIPNSKFQIVNVFAHREGESEGSPSGDLTPSLEATGSAMNDTAACKTLQKQLEDLARKKKLWKLTVVPRPQLDTTIALTAWGYIDKFDQFDKKRLERFIDFHRDHGPEKTME